MYVFLIGRRVDFAIAFWIEIVRVVGLVCFFLVVLGFVWLFGGWGEEMRSLAWYFLKVSYVLTILRGLKELFMICLGFSRLRIIGMLS